MTAELNDPILSLVLGWAEGEQVGRPLGSEFVRSAWKKPWRDS